MDTLELYAWSYLILLGQAMLYITWNTGVGDGFRYVQV